MKIKHVLQEIINRSVDSKKPVEVAIFGITEEIHNWIDMETMTDEEINYLLEQEVCYFVVRRRFSLTQGPLYLVYGKIKPTHRA